MTPSALSYPLEVGDEEEENEKETPSNGELLELEKSCSSKESFLREESVDASVCKL